MTVEAEAAGVLEIVVAGGETVPVGDADRPRSAREARAPTRADEPARRRAGREGARARTGAAARRRGRATVGREPAAATPLARRIADAHGVALGR